VAATVWCCTGEQLVSSRASRGSPNRKKPSKFGTSADALRCPAPPRLRGTRREGREADDSQEWRSKERRTKRWLGFKVAAWRLSQLHDHYHRDDDAGELHAGLLRCLLPASDYECRGRHGHGPKYTGRVQVTGSDPHGLDEDGDGVGCE
jgi:hypothetical protein